MAGPIVRESIDVRPLEGPHTLSSASQRPPIGHVDVGALKVGPKAYGVNAEGDCLAPHYNDGDVLIIDPDQTPQSGDFVAVWWKGGRRAPAVKRLVMFVSGEFEPAIVCEQLNPPRSYSAPMSSIEAVHKVIGKAEERP